MRPGSLVPFQIQTLRNQLKEKEKATDRVEVRELFCPLHILCVLSPLSSLSQREYSQDKLAWEREEKLVVSAWYEMVSTIMLGAGLQGLR